MTPRLPLKRRAKAARLLRDIQGGQDFALVARDWSEDPDSAPNGGDLSFRSLADLEKIDPKVEGGGAKTEGRREQPFD